VHDVRRFDLSRLLKVGHCLKDAATLVTGREVMDDLSPRGSAQAAVHEGRQGLVTGVRRPSCFSYGHEVRSFPPPLKITSLPSLMRGTRIVIFTVRSIISAVAGKEGDMQVIVPCRQQTAHLVTAH